MNLSAAVVKRSSSLVSLLQPIADGVKLLMKGIIPPTNANKALPRPATGSRRHAACREPRCIERNGHAGEGSLKTLIRLA
jgi:NADH dehydrogenase